MLVPLSTRASAVVSGTRTKVPRLVIVLGVLGWAVLLTVGTAVAAEATLSFSSHPRFAVVTLAALMINYWCAVRTMRRIAT